MSGEAHRWSEETVALWRAILAKRGLPAERSDALRILDQIAPGVRRVLRAEREDRVRCRAP